MAFPTTLEQATWWLLCHALNNLHEHQGTRTETGCSDGCRPSEEGCCPQCCGPCGALAYFANDPSAKAYADRLSQTFGGNTDPEGKWGPYSWRWQKPTGEIDWDQVYQCWAKDPECWCNLGDDDLDLEEVHQLVQPGDRPDLY